MERVTSWHFEKISTVRLKLHRLWWGSAAWKQLRVPPLSPSRPRVVNLNEDDFPSVVCKSALTPHALSLSRKKHSTKMGTRWMRERKRQRRIITSFREREKRPKVNTPQCFFDFFSYGLCSALLVFHVQHGKVSFNSLVFFLFSLSVMRIEVELNIFLHQIWIVEFSHSLNALILRTLRVVSFSKRWNLKQITTSIL